MKKLFFILVIYFSANQVFAIDESLKYDFKIGDEFVVKVRSYGQVYNKYFLHGLNFNALNPTSLDLYFSFNPISRKNGITKMDVTILRIVRWHYYRCYDTQIQMSAIDSYESIFSELINKSFKVFVDIEGTVVSLEGIEAIYEAILNKKFSDNFSQFYNNSFRKAFSDIQFKNMVQYAFPNTGNASALMESETNPDLISVVFKAQSSMFKNDFYLLNEGNIELQYPLTGDTVSFSKSRGRFVSGELKGSNEFYNEEIPGSGGLKNVNNDWIIINRAATNISYDPKNMIDLTLKVTLNGKIEGMFPNKGSLYMQQRYPDHEAFPRQEFEIDEQGNFELIFDLQRPMDLTLRFGEITSELTFSKDIFLEPGDELKVHIENNSDQPQWSFAGKAALKFQLLDQLEAKIVPYKLSESENLDTLITRLRNELNNFEKLIKNQPLSVWAKKYLKTNLFVAINNSVKGPQYRPRSSIKELNKLHIKWMEQNERGLYIYPEVNNTKTFIDTYILLKKTELQRSTWKIEREEVKYNVSKVLLDGELLYYSGGKYLHEAIQKADLKLAEKLLSDFQSKFPDTELVEIFKRQLGDLDVIKEGGLAPDFTVSTPDGKKISLSEYKGSWCYLFFMNYDDELNRENLNNLQLLKDSVEGPFRVILILTNSTASSKLIRSIREVYSGDLLLNPDWEGENTLSYKVTKAKSVFLINPEGRFELVWDERTESGYKSKTFSNVISDYIRLKQPEFSKSAFQKSHVLWSLLCVTLVAILIWLYFKMRQKRFKRDEARKREKVQLELKAIRSQLNPHFMYNTLNSIQHLVGDDRKEEACQYISEFSGLMRQVLNNSDKALTSLNEEIKALQTYLRLEALRFGFDYQVEVDPLLETDLIEIPGLMVQPFVENAVIHGVSKLKENGRIRISFQLHKSKLICCVDDNGGGYAEVKNTLLNGQGIALSRKRLQVLKDTYQLEIGVVIKNKKDIDPLKNGTLVEITYELNDV